MQAAGVRGGDPGHRRELLWDAAPAEPRSRRRPWRSAEAAAAEAGPGGRGRCWPRARRRDRRGARHQLELWGGECGEERHAPSRRAAFKFVVWPQQLSWERLSLSKKGMLKTPGITSPLPISSPSPRPPFPCARQSSPARPSRSLPARRLSAAWIKCGSGHALACFSGLATPCTVWAAASDVWAHVWLADFGTYVLYTVRTSRGRDGTNNVQKSQQNLKKSTCVPVWKTRGR